MDDSEKKMPTVKCTGLSLEIVESNEKQRRVSLIESLRGQLSGLGEMEQLQDAQHSHSLRSSAQRQSTECQPEIAHNADLKQIEIHLLDVDDCCGDLDDPACNSRKRLYSQSDVDFNQINERKKINPFSSALSAAPYYFHDFKKKNDKNIGESNQIGNGLHKPSNNLTSLLHVKEFKPTAAPLFHQQTDSVDMQSMSNFSGACGIPTYSESLTMNDGQTAQGNEVSNWRTTAPEFVPKGLNQLAVQGQLPSQLSQLPVNATAETAFLKLNFRHHQACSFPANANANSYLEIDAHGNPIGQQN